MLCNRYLRLLTSIIAIVILTASASANCIPIDEYGVPCLKWIDTKTTPGAICPQVENRCNRTFVVRFATTGDVKGIPVYVKKNGISNSCCQISSCGSVMMMEISEDYCRKASATEPTDRAGPTKASQRIEPAVSPGFQPVPPPSNRPAPGFKGVNASPTPRPVAPALNCITHAWDGDVLRLKNACDYPVQVFHCFRGSARFDARCARSQWGVTPMAARGEAWLGAYEMHGTEFINKGGYRIAACRNPARVENWRGFEWSDNTNRYLCGVEHPAGGDPEFLKRYTAQLQFMNMRIAADFAAIEAKGRAERFAASERRRREEQKERDRENARQVIEALGAIVKGIAASRSGGGVGQSGSGNVSRGPCNHPNAEAKC